MSKSPYEIRLEVLKLAQDQATQKFYNDWEQAVRKSELSVDKLSECTLLTEVPVFPTADQILAEANKLKGFVDKG